MFGVYKFVKLYYIANPKLCSENEEYDVGECHKCLQLHGTNHVQLPD